MITSIATTSYPRRWTFFAVSRVDSPSQSPTVRPGKTNEEVFQEPVRRDPPETFQRFWRFRQERRVAQSQVLPLHASTTWTDGRSSKNPSTAVTPPPSRLAPSINQSRPPAFSLSSRAFGALVPCLSLHSADVLLSRLFSFFSATLLFISQSQGSLAAQAAPIRP